MSCIYKYTRRRVKFSPYANKHSTYEPHRFINYHENIKLHFFFRVNKPRDILLIAKSIQFFPLEIKYHSEYHLLNYAYNSSPATL